MISANPMQRSAPETFVQTPEKIRHAAFSKEPIVFTDIYKEDINIAIWQRELSSSLQNSVNALLLLHPTFQITTTVTPANVFSILDESLVTSGQSELNENIAELVDMFCCLFELKQTGLRLTALDKAMCPRFHVDKVPCRLVSTYQGSATQWLPHQLADRTKLGRGSNGKPDHQSGLFQHQHDIQQLNSGDVALLKGENWEGNEHAGLLHRSPVISTDTSRLLLTLDFSG